MATCGRDSSSSDEEIPKPKVINKRRLNNFMSSNSEEDSEIDVKSKQKRKVKRLRESDSETDSGLSTSTSWTSIPKIRKNKNRKSGHDVDDNQTTSNDFSDGEQSEKCAICLCKFLDQPVASPETCDHTFCSTCLLEWAKKVNTCPIDRMRFRYVLIKHQNSPDLCERIPVTNQRRFVVTSSDSSDAVICEMCGDESSTNLMLCDRCGLGYHTSCVPEMFPLSTMSLEWYCPYCQHVRNEENVRLRRLFLQQIGRECVGHEYVRLRRLNVLLFNPNRQSVPSYSMSHDSNSSSADSSDESSELSSSSERRQRCQAKRTPTKLLDQFISAFRRTTARHTTPSTSSRSHSFYTTNDSDSDDLDYGYEDNGGVISSVRRNPVMRSKGIRTSCRLRFRASSPPGSRTDILEDILAMQTRLHGPASSVEESVSVNVNPSNIGLQQPMHPVQKSSTSSNGSRHSAFPSSSSSSAASGSSQYDLYNMPSCSALTHSTSAESYNTESCSTMTHCSYGNTNVTQDDFKKDAREASHVKDGRKSQSDDEVDIYSDIEYANDEASLDADVQAMSVSYKPDESHLSTVGDGTDSSDDNDLIIDEDVPAEEENRHSVDKKAAVNSTLSEAAAESENSSDSCLADDCEPASEDNIPESAQSPDTIENANLESESRWPEHNESEESTEQVCNDKSSYEAKTYVDSDGDSQEVECEDNNTRDGNHSQMSFNSNYDNQGPKSPDDENGSSPLKSMTPVMEDNSTDNATEDFERTLPEENDQDSIVEQDHSENSNKEMNENDDNMNDTNSATKSENSDDEDNGNRTDEDECGIKTEVEDGVNKSEDEEDENKSEDEEIEKLGEVDNKTDDEIDNKTDEEVDNKTDDENDGKSDEENNKTDDEGGNKTEEEEEVNNKTDDEGDNKIEYDGDNKMGYEEKGCESDENNNKNEDNECSNDNCDNMGNSSPINEVMTSENQSELTSDELPKESDSPKPFTNSTKKSVTEIRSSGKEFPTKASLKECIPVEGEFETNKNSHEDNTYQNIDLGIEDISDAASDDLNQLDNDTPEPMECDSLGQATLDDVEKNVAKLFDADDSSPSKHNRRHQRNSFHERTSDDTKRYSSSSRQALIDDQEEGEIIEDIPYSRKENRREHFAHDDDEYMDSTPRINISDLPRIPKIKRESKPNIPEEPPLELKRTSVLGRVDLGNSDVGWKRLSKHTRERSYRDGRPKDETVLFRERELKSKDKNRKHSSNERKNDSKLMEIDRRKNEEKKQERDRSRDRNQSDRSRERRSNKSEHEKSAKQMDWSYAEKKDKEKHTKHKDRYEREKMKKDRHESKKDRHDKNKEKSRRDDSKHEREKVRAEEKYAREVERYHQNDEAYERMYEKPRDKEHKHKHKESKSESAKKCKDEKHKRTHSREHFSEKREREVRKVDDKLKIVVEHKESRIKDKSDKIGEKRDAKHDKKHRDNTHHHERKKKDLSPISYSELTPIESKEIFAKGDSIIINVNFNRASPREVIAGGSEEFTRDKKSNSSDLTKIDNFNLDDSHGSKSKHSSLDSDKKSDAKRPSTPTERTNQAISANECYWSDADDADAKSPNAEKSPADKMCNEDEDSSNSPPNNFGADDNLTDSGDEENLPETQPVNLLSKEGIEPDVSSVSSEKAQQENLYPENKETENFNSSRRRSPIHPPSPPSPPDNDSYDPCEPTKSPSPPPNPSSPPLPTMCLSDRPKPPPSPELPPLPPEPEPTDTVFQEDGHSVKSSVPCQPSDMPNSSASSPVVSQLEHYNTSGNEPTNAGPGILLPPPRFMGHVNVSTMSSQLTPSKTMSWHVQNPPSTMLFQSSHLQPVIRGNFLPSHIPTVGLPPPNVSANMLPPNSSIPLMSQVRHLQLGPHSIVPTNTLLPNIPMNHLNLPQVQISHMNPPLPNPSVAVSVQQHQTITMQGHPGNLPNSISSHCGGIGLMPPQNQLSGIAISLQNQHGNLVPTLHQQNVSQSFPTQNQVSHPGPSNSQKSDKLSKTSPAKDRSEVIDMDVDSPYSPGDSPSMDSAYDYSPPSSPVPHEGSVTKDVFDTLLGPERSSSTHSNKVSNKNRHSSNCVEREGKRQKGEARNDSNKNRHHSIRLQVSEKMKSRKEHRVSERRDVISRVDDSQLTILDELPSSAVEMQVKEKFIKKLNRQERVVEEVKCALKPYYKAREVSKDEYKDILRKCVPKICHNKSGEINPQKVKYLVECYVRKVKHSRKKSSKRHKSSKLS